MEHGEARGRPRAHRDWLKLRWGNSRRNPGSGLTDGRARVRSARASALAVRADDALPLHLRAADARAGAAAGGDADALAPNGRREVAPADALLRDALPDQLRDRRCHRPGHGVPVRHELVGLLDLRRRRLRLAARDRGPRGVHARSDLHRPLGLRLEPALAAGAPRDHLPRLARHVALGVLHPDGELLDAAPGRLRAQLADRPRGGQRHLRDPLPGVRVLRLDAHHPCRAPDRRFPGARRRLLASTARQERRPLP